MRGWRPAQRSGAHDRWRGARLRRVRAEVPLAARGVRAAVGGGSGRPPVRQVKTVLMTNAAFCGSARKRTRPCEHSTMSTARGRGAQASALGE